jgi:hypothetical protein
MMRMTLRLSSTKTPHPMWMTHNYTGTRFFLSTRQKINLSGGNQRRAQRRQAVNDPRGDQEGRCASRQHHHPWLRCNARGRGRRGRDGGWSCGLLGGVSSVTLLQSHSKTKAASTLRLWDSVFFGTKSAIWLTSSAEYGRGTRSSCRSYAW